MQKPYLWFQIYISFILLYLQHTTILLLAAWIFMKAFCFSNAQDNALTTSLELLLSYFIFSSRDLHAVPTYKLFSSDLLKIHDIMFDSICITNDLSIWIHGFLCFLQPTFYPWNTCLLQSAMGCFLKGTSIMCLRKPLWCLIYPSLYMLENYFCTKPVT